MGDCILVQKGKGRVKGKSVNLKPGEKYSQSLCNVLCIFSWERVCVEILVYKRTKAKLVTQNKTKKKHCQSWTLSVFLVFDSFVGKRRNGMFKEFWGTSLVAQWLRICLPMQGRQVRALVREDPTCRGATKPVRHNYWASALEPVRLEPLLRNKRSHGHEKPAHCNKE